MTDPTEVPKMADGAYFTTGKGSDSRGELELADKEAEAEGEGLNLFICEY